MSNQKPANFDQNVEDKADFSFTEALNRLIADFPERSKNIILLRYGIESGKPATLEEIGKKYNITRERVRQIVQEVFRKIAKRESKLLQEVADKILFTTEEKSGIISKEDLMERASKGSDKEKSALVFFLESLKNPVAREIKGQMNLSYTSKDLKLDLWKNVIKTTREVLEKGREALTSDELFGKVADLVKNIGKNQFLNYLAVSQEIRENNFGKWGLVQWEEISPKGTREKAHLVLKETGKPLHFRKIADLIDKYKLNSKKTHPQTVHNELIKDDRFVLVGRGVYALSEWGYKRGTVREVLEDIIKKQARPMSREDILNEILRMRQVKKSTVMINLNNFFVRTGNNEYTVRK